MLCDAILYYAMLCYVLCVMYYVLCIMYYVLCIMYYVLKHSLCFVSLSRALKAVTERLVSCGFQRRQAQERLAELQRHSSALPKLFPWPGLGDRRQAAEEARTLLDRTRAQGPLLKALHRQVQPYRYTDYITNRNRYHSNVFKTHATQYLHPPGGGAVCHDPGSHLERPFLGRDGGLPP